MKYLKLVIFFSPILVRKITKISEKFLKIPVKTENPSQFLETDFPRTNKLR